MSYLKYSISDNAVKNYIDIGYPCRYVSCPCKCTTEEVIKYHNILKSFGKVKFLMRNLEDINSDVGIFYKGYIYWSKLCYREALFKAIQYHWQQ